MRIVIRNARLSFPDLFEAVQFDGQGPFSYRCTLLIPSDSDVKKQIDSAIKETADGKWGAKAPAILEKAKLVGKICFTDGNLKDYNGYADNWALVTSRKDSDGAPAVIDRDKTPLGKGSGKLYSGCYVNAIVDFFPQDNTYGKTVRSGLVSVQYVKDGESFGGAAPVTVDGFDDLGFDEDEGDDLA